MFQCVCVYIYTHTYIYIYMYMYIYTCKARLLFQNDLSSPIYWVATINRPLKIQLSFANEPLNVGLFCKRAPQKRPTKRDLYCAKETYMSSGAYKKHATCLKMIYHLQFVGWLRLIESFKKCRSFFQKSPTKETYILQKTYTFKQPTNRGHPI